MIFNATTHDLCLGGPGLVLVCPPCTQWSGSAPEHWTDKHVESYKYWKLPDPMKSIIHIILYNCIDSTTYNFKALINCLDFYKDFFVEVLSA